MPMDYRTLIAAALVGGIGYGAWAVAQTPGTALAPAPATAPVGAPRPQAAAGGAEPGTGELVWTEDATRLYFNRALRLAWTNNVGDWLDAEGRLNGSAPFATLRLSPRSAGPVSVDVTRLVREHGADFRLEGGGGKGVRPTFASREAPDGAPRLVIREAGGRERVLSAVADTSLSPTTFGSMGGMATLRAIPAAMIRFDQGADRSIQSATLHLTALKVSGEGSVNIYRPRVAYAAPDAAALAVAAAGPRQGGPARVIAEFGAGDIRDRSNRSKAGGVVTAWFEGTQLTALNDQLKLKTSPESAYLTVYIRLHDDWRAPAGKLPGFSNTGNNREAVPCTVNGARAPAGGWGGRPANGCRWSARTGFVKRVGNTVSAGTYYYAVSPRDTNGVSDPWALPMPVGQWFAYVQHVRLNDPGVANGVLGYWLVAEGPARGGKPVYANDKIVWRTTGGTGSAINEVWADVYCGGRDCGPEPWPRYTMSVERFVVTSALPDLGAVQARVDQLNRQLRTARR